MSKPLRFCVPLLVLLVAPLVSLAGDSPDEQLFTRLSEKRLEQILAKEQIDYERKVTKVNGKDLVYYQVKITNYKGIITMSNNGLTFEASFKDRNNNDVTLERANEWNLKKRFCRAFVDKDGWGVMQSDLDMFAGTNEKMIRSWLALCKELVRDFDKFVR